MYCVYAYNKNYQDQEPDNDDEEDEFNPMTIDERYKTFTFDWMFKKIIEICDDQAPNKIRLIANWKLKSNENILKSLLVNGQDSIACEFAEFYLHDAGMDLMIFCLRNYNEIFLKFALR